MARVVFDCLNIVWSRHDDYIRYLDRKSHDYVYEKIEYRGTCWK